MLEITGQIPLDQERGVAPLTLVVKGGEVHEDSRLTLGRIGSIYQLPDHRRGKTPVSIDGQALCRRYLSAGGQLSFTRHLGGQYTVVIHDRERARLLILQDPSSSPLNLYYCVVRQALHFSSSLHRLLVGSRVPRRWDAGRREFFLRNGCLPGGGTLLQGVAKLAPGKALEACLGTGQIALRDLCAPSLDLGLFDALSRYHGALEQVLRQTLTSAGPNLGIVLSGGYDTNLLLNLLRQEDRSRRQVFTVGGRTGRDEIPRATSIARRYENLEHRIGRVGPWTLERFPEIVWRLEGAVYEKGIFLQYELARLVAASHTAGLICGECADQVLKAEFHRPARTRPARLSWKRDPRELALNLVLKKSGLMLNSFSVTPHYPYLSPEVVTIAKALAPLNGHHKLGHKLSVLARVGPSLGLLLTKRGGSTSLGALIDGSSRLRWLRAAIQRTWCAPFLHERYAQPIFGRREREIDLLCRVLQLYLFGELFLSGAHDQVATPSGPGLLLEQVIG